MNYVSAISILVLRLVGAYLFYLLFIYGLQVVQYMNLQSFGPKWDPALGLMYLFFGVQLALAISCTVFAPRLVKRFVPSTPHQPPEAPTVESLSVLAVVLVGIFFLVPALESTLLHSWRVSVQPDAPADPAPIIRALVHFSAALPFLFRSRKVAAWLIRCGSR